MLWPSYATTESPPPTRGHAGGLTQSLKLRAEVVPPTSLRTRKQLHLPPSRLGKWVARPVRRRPNVWEIVRRVGEERCVCVRVFAHQRRPVAAVEGAVAEPGRQFPGGRQQHLMTNLCTGTECEEISDECGRTAVLMTVFPPHLADFQAIPDQRFLVSSPHPHCWMAAPPVSRHDKATKNLQRLDPLFAESATIQDQGRGPEVGIGQESLHAVTPAFSDGRCGGCVGRGKEQDRSWRCPARSGASRRQC